MGIVLVAVATVYIASFLVTNFSTALTTSVLVLSNTVCVIGFVWALNPTAGDPFGTGPYGVDINAVSVVNLVTAVGLSVEFCIHITSYFSAAHGTKLERAKAALVEMGSSVFTGISLTKFVGVLVLAWAPSALFRLYYFRMYLAIIVMGAFHGLMLLPALLSIIGWASTGAGADSASSGAASGAAVRQGRKDDSNSFYEGGELDYAAASGAGKRLQ